MGQGTRPQGLPAVREEGRLAPQGAQEPEVEAVVVAGSALDRALRSAMAHLERGACRAAWPHVRSALLLYGAAAPGVKEQYRRVLRLVERAFHARCIR